MPTNLEVYQLLKDEAAVVELVEDEFQGYTPEGSGWLMLVDWVADRLRLYTGDKIFRLHPTMYEKAIRYIQAGGWNRYQIVCWPKSCGGPIQYFEE